MVLGGWNLAEMKEAELPEEAAKAFKAVTEHLVGAGYKPVLYCGSQVVHGTNYMVICEQTIVVPDFPKHLVTMVINSSEKGSCIVSIEQII